MQGIVLTELRDAALANLARYQEVVDPEVLEFILNPPHPHPAPVFLPARASWEGAMHPALTHSRTGLPQPLEVKQKAAGQRPRAEVSQLAAELAQEEQERQQLVADHLAHVAGQQAAPAAAGAAV